MNSKSDGREAFVVLFGRRAFVAESERIAHESGSAYFAVASYIAGRAIVARGLTVGVEETSFRESGKRRQVFLANHQLLNGQLFNARALNGEV